MPIAAFAATALACSAGGGSGGSGAQTAAAPDTSLTGARERMVTETIVARGVDDTLVLGAMRRVPRHLFIPHELVSDAYADHPLPIGEGQTISQPYIVALMTELLRLRPGDKVLEIGTGSGYQAAVLAEITKPIYSIEIVDSLAKSAAARLKALGYATVEVRSGDGYRGWPEVAPFDAIIVTAAPDHIPQPLLDQLAPGGRLVLPVGDESQELRRITKRPDGTLADEEIIPVRFVPMTGEAEKKREAVGAPK
jgi:protein-L-isoaspartate(D-aspartate) O-methyltransferase